MQNSGLVWTRFWIVLCVSVAFAWQCMDQMEPLPSASGVELSAPAKEVTAPQAMASAVYPDLTVDADRLAKSIQVSTKNFKNSDCAVIEGCAQPGRRRLLKYDVAIPNFGLADLVVGNPTDPANAHLFEYSGCHRHYHLRDFTEYRLVDGNGNIVSGRKQAFCLMDVVRYTAGAPSGGYNCGYQGISVGWADVYDRSLDCQWIDITGIPSGRYTLEVEVNVGNIFGEGDNLRPNIARVPVTIR